MWFRVQKVAEIQGWFLAFLLLTVPQIVSAENNITPSVNQPSQDATPHIPPSPEDSESSPVTQASASGPSESVMYAILESRPTWQLSGNRFYMTNFAEAGFRTQKFSVGYRQQFINNIFDARGLTGNGNFVFSDGFLRFQKNDIVTTNTGLSLSWEPRIYLPTDPGKLNSGFLTGMRNYFKFNAQLGKSGFGFMAYEIPIFYVYDKREINGVKNPVFENRTILALDYTFLGGRANFQVPVFLNYVANADFRYWVYPEFLYTIDNSLKVGMAYQMGTLIDADFTSLAVDNAFQRGITQFILQLRF